MPPEHRPSDLRKTWSQNKTRFRRARGEISCAECRRLKLKCNKTIPCSACVRRRCAQLCPNESQATLRGPRNTAAQVDHLRANVEILKERIHRLEDALAFSHALTSYEPHPLLKSRLPEHNDSSSVSSENADTDMEGDQNTDKGNISLELDILQHSFRKLAIEEQVDEPKQLIDDRAELLEILHHVPQSAYDEQARRKSPLTLSAQIAWLSKLFPTASSFSGFTHETQEAIESMLPTYERACELADGYLTNLAWFFMPVDREQVMDELIPAAYGIRRRSNTEETSTNGSEEYMDPHDLALLLGVLALGTVADLSLAPLNDEGELYYHACRAALGLKSVFDETTLATVQTVCVMTCYVLYSNSALSLDGPDKMLSFACMLTLQLGLHRDPARCPTLPERTIQKLRLFFWEIYSADTRMALRRGMPAAFHSSIVNCLLPEDPLPVLGDDGVLVASEWSRRHRFVKEILAEVVEILSSKQDLKYSDILAMDRKIRAFDADDTPTVSKLPRVLSAEENNAMLLLGKLCDIVVKNNTLTMLHRPFFLIACFGKCSDPTQTAFAPSFLAAYRSATLVLHENIGHIEKLPQFILRVWPVWSGTLSSGCILGIVSSLGPKVAIAREAYTEFMKALEGFSGMRMHPLVKACLPVLRRVQAKAYLRLMDGKNVVDGRNISGSSWHREASSMRQSAQERERDFGEIGSEEARSLPGSPESGFKMTGRQPYDPLDAVEASTSTQSTHQLSNQLLFASNGMLSMLRPLTERLRRLKDSPGPRMASTVIPSVPKNDNQSLSRGSKYSGPTFPASLDHPAAPQSLDQSKFPRILQHLGPQHYAFDSVVDQSGYDPTSFSMPIQTSVQDSPCPTQQQQSTTSAATNLHVHSDVSRLLGLPIPSYTSAQLRSLPHQYLSFELQNENAWARQAGSAELGSASVPDFDVSLDAGFAMSSTSSTNQQAMLSDEDMELMRAILQDLRPTEAFDEAGHHA